MKVFITWSGNSSKQVAQNLHQWLTKVLPYVEPWMSDKDIPKGTVWPTELWRNLREADFGIICLVPENITEPWIIFEVGALSGKRNRERVSPFILGIKPEDLPDPIRLLQSTRFEKDDIFGLVERINQLASKKALSQQEVKELFQKNWQWLNRRLKAIDLNSGKEVNEETKQNDGQSATKELRLDKIHIDILRLLTKSHSRWTLCSRLALALNKDSRLISLKINDLVKIDFVQQSVSTKNLYIFRITEKGVRFLDAQGLI